MGALGRLADQVGRSEMIEWIIEEGGATYTEDGTHAQLNETGLAMLRSLQRGWRSRFTEAGRFDRDVARQIEQEWHSLGRVRIPHPKRTG
jgi:hypothetical protein